MFGKKLIASVLSLGIISACSMGALAGTVSGTGMSSGDPNHMYGAISIDYSITTTYTGNGPFVINRMQFCNTPGGPVTSYIDCNIYFQAPNPSDPPMINRYSGGDTSYISGTPGYMQCVLSEFDGGPEITIKVDSTFHYSTSYFGSFTGGLTKYGW